MVLVPWSWGAEEGPDVVGGAGECPGTAVKTVNKRRRLPSEADRGSTAKLKELQHILVGTGAPQLGLRQPQMSVILILLSQNPRNWRSPFTAL